MAIPSDTLKTYEKNRVDLAIEYFSKIESPTTVDLNVVKTQGSIQCGIDQYRIGALSMTEKQRLNEEHNSARLAGFMEASTDPKPHKLCHCHAIVSGSHGEAAAARAVMAWLAMRIDDPRNGCWLPANTEARKNMPERLKNAIPHSRIHRKTYYRWLDENISFTLTDSIETLASKLRMVRVRLQSGSVPPVILLDLGYKT